MSKIREEMKKTYNIWGRDLDIDVIFECYGKDSVTEAQVATFNKFERDSGKYFNEAYVVLEKYVIEKYTDCLDNGRIDNIFKYIVPRELFFKQYTEDKDCFGLICHFKFDQENGIAVRFVGEKITKVGPEQII